MKIDLCSSKKGGPSYFPLMQMNLILEKEFSNLFEFPFLGYTLFFPLKILT